MKRWQEYPEELHKKDLNDPDNCNGVITHLEPDILECKDKGKNKGLCSQSYGFPRSHVRMWELGHKEGGTLKNWCLRTVVLEKTPESLLDCKEIKPVDPTGSKSWIFIGRTDAEAETPVLWPPDMKNWLIGKDCDAGKDWGQEEKGTTEDKMAGLASLTWWTSRLVPCSGYQKQCYNEHGGTSVSLK